MVKIFCLVSVASSTISVGWTEGNSENNVTTLHFDQLLALSMGQRGAGFLLDLMAKWKTVNIVGQFRLEQGFDCVVARYVCRSVHQQAFNMGPLLFFKSQCVSHKQQLAPLTMGQRLDPKLPLAIVT